MIIVKADSDSDSMEGSPVDINSVAAQLEFKPTRKKSLEYRRVENDQDMPPMTYTTAKQSTPVVTITSDGKETQNVAAPGDVIMSGATGEKYVLKAAKFPKLYQEVGEGRVVPEQSPRMVALYTGKDPVKFVASWGEDMILKPNDYLVREADGKNYYRIAKVEYEKTYNPPGQ